MNKFLILITTLIIAIIILSFSFTVLYIGKNLFGSDATILWASGILAYISMSMIIQIIVILWYSQKNEKKVVVDE